MLPFFAWKIFSISFFISLDFYLQVLFVVIFYVGYFLYVYERLRTPPIANNLPSGILTDGKSAPA